MVGCSTDLEVGMRGVVCDLECRGICRTGKSYFSLGRKCSNGKGKGKGKGRTRDTKVKKEWEKNNRN